MKNDHQFKTNGGVALTCAAIASMGSLWRFVFKAGEHGGGAFILLFIVMAALVGVGLMMDELALGNIGSKEGVRPEHIKWLGYLGCGTCVLLPAIYSVLGGWSLFYSASSINGVNGVMTVSPDAMEAFWMEFAGGAWTPLLFLLVFVALAVFIVIRGQALIEKICKILLPVIWLLIAVLVVRTLTLAGWQQNIGFLLRPDFSALTLGSVADAGVQALLSFGLGMMVLAMYAACASRGASLPLTVSRLTALSVLTPVMMAVIVFPALTTYGIETNGGPYMLFVQMAQALSMMPIGWLFSALFYLLAALCALASCIAIMQLPITMLQSKINCRVKAGVIVGLAVFLMGAAIALGVGPLKADIMGVVDFVVSRILLPICALGAAALVGFFAKPQPLMDGLFGRGSGRARLIWYSAMKTTVPVLLALTFAAGLFNW